jgi:hypothetical protein
VNTGRVDGPGVQVNELVPFVHTATKFSGRRLWLKCLSCHQRCRVIYGGRYLRCRRCHGLSYQSQREPAYDRAIEQAYAIPRGRTRPLGASALDSPLTLRSIPASLAVVIWQTCADRTDRPPPEWSDLNVERRRKGTGQAVDRPLKRDIVLYKLYKRCNRKEPRARVF